MLFILILSILANIALVYVCRRFIQRVIQFDNVLTLIMGQVKDHKEYLNGLNSRYLLSDTPEILNLVKNLKNMENSYGILYEEYAEGEEENENV